MAVAVMAEEEGCRPMLDDLPPLPLPPPPLFEAVAESEPNLPESAGKAAKYFSAWSRVLGTCGGFSAEMAWCVLAELLVAVL